MTLNYEFVSNVCYSSVQSVPYKSGTFCSSVNEVKISNIKHQGPVAQSLIKLILG